MFHIYRTEKVKFKPKRFFLVFNRLAGKTRRESVQDVLSLAKDYGIEFERVYVLPEDRLDFEFESNDVLFMRGGDGTTHLFLTELVSRGGEIPVFAHIYGGSMCTVERCLRIPDRRTLFMKIERYLEDGYFVFVPRPSIEFVSDNEKRYGFLFGAILPPTFLKDYYSHNETGPKIALKTLAYYIKGILLMKEEVIRKFKQERAKLISKNFSIERDFCLIGASTVHSFGLNFSTFPKAPMCSSEFNLIATSISPFLLTLFLPFIYFGILPPSSLNLVLDEVSISFKSQKDFTIDGDIYSAKDLILKTGPVVRFIT